MMDASTAIAIIERLAGPATFERGTAIYNDQAILSFHKNRNKIKATVQSASAPGVKVYQVTLTIKPTSYDGGCDCPASEGFDFCKHCVAVALQHADKLAQLEAAQGGSAIDRIQALIEDMDEQQAKNALLTCITQDEESILAWRLRADISQEFAVGNTKGSVITELKTLITKALPFRDVWQYNKARAYFQQAQEKLSLIIGLLQYLPAEQAHAVAYQILKRYDKIFERVDDSGGFRFELEHDILAAFATAVQRLTWSVSVKANYLLSFYSPDLDVMAFTDIPQRFIASTDDELREAFYTQLEQDVTAETNGNDRINFTVSIKMHDLCDYYAAKSDYSKAIEIFTQVAWHADDFLQLVKWAIAAKDVTVALQFLAQTRETDTYQKLTKECLALEAEVARLQGDPEAAIELQWQTYTHSLVLDDYIQLQVQIAKTYQHSDSDCDSDTDSELVTAKQTWQDKTLLFWDEILATLPTERAGPHRLITAEPFVELCLYLGLVERAIELAKHYPIDRDVLYQVAAISGKYAPEQTFDLYRRLILIWIKTAKSADYKKIINLLLELQGLLPDLPVLAPPDNVERAFDFFINEIAYEFAQKRQLQTMIKRHFVV
ncbi:MAG: hypothetical protein P8Q24_08970 [Glaciecola sp.]|nr:hypothetical protein [Glaciecola sp.]MDG1469274.1 hypothetical protein [Glaciecola sp.]MDG1922506.1 hypothetical protein [Glaciecola sp.]